MTTNSFRGLLVATAAAAIFAASGAQAQPKAPTPKLTSGVAKALTDAQKASQTSDWAAAKAAIAAAAAVPNRNDYDNYMIAQFSITTDARTNDMAGATLAAQQAADSPAQPDADKPRNLRVATQLSLNDKQYDKALVYGKSMAALNPTDSVSIQTIAEAYYFGKDYPNAVIMTQKVIDMADAAHTKIEHNTLDLLMLSQVALKDEAGAEKTLERVVAEYNEPAQWGQIIDIAFGTPGQRDVDAVWLGRLLLVTGATANGIAADASILGQAANKLTFYGDAQAAQKIGGTGYADPTANADKDKKAMPAQIAAGQKANSQYNAKLAEALYGYGMYPESEAAARLAISKGGAADPSEAPMILGQTLAAEGKYDEALASFAQVTGGSVATPRIVRLWVDYVKIKKTPPAPAAAAAAK